MGNRSKQASKQASLFIGLVLVVACNNESVTEGPEPTLGATESESDSETGPPEEPACWTPGAEGYEPQDPTLFQCVGVGAGELEFFQCESLSCEPDDAAACDFGNPGEWGVGSEPAGPFPFPPEPPETAPNAQACCESDATPEETMVGCEDDCARAACNEALAALEQAVLNVELNPPAFCGTECKERAKTSLQTWIDFLEAEFDSCVEAALRGVPFFLPTPDVDAGPGALTCGKLELGCTLDPETDAFDLEEECSTSLNEPLTTSPLILECEIDGEVEVDGPQGYASTPLEGTVTLRRENPCTSGSCWFSIDSLEAEADPFSGSGYIGLDMEASLAYRGFGLLDSSSDEGTIATGMFSLDVTMEGATPTTSLQVYSFRMANSDSAVFEISTAGFEIIDAYFAWPEHDVLITSDLGDCVCLNCT